MPALVADVSVLAAIAFGESTAQRARTELQGARLYEPSLLPYELASIARAKIRRDPRQRQLILRSLVIILSKEMELIEVDQVAVVRLAWRAASPPTMPHICISHVRLACP